MIALGCDHGGYELKQEILKYLEKEGYEVKDFGCFSTATTTAQWIILFMHAK